MTDVQRAHPSGREANLRMDGWLPSNVYRRVDGALQRLWFIPETGDTQWVAGEETQARITATVTQQSDAFGGGYTPRGEPPMTLPPMLRESRRSHPAPLLAQRTVQNVLPAKVLEDIEATRFKPVMRSREKSVEPCRTISGVLKMALGVDSPKQLTVADFEHVHSAEVNLACLFLGAEDPAWSEWYQHAAAEQSALREKRKNLEPSNAVDG